MWVKQASKRWVASIGVASGVAYQVSALEEKPIDSSKANPHTKELKKGEVITAAPVALSPKPALKRYTLQEMTDMCDEGRIVVGLKGKLYDVTNFSGHPGGTGRLQMAAGNDLEAFWSVYTQHNRGHVVDNLLTHYEIGTLSPEDAETLRKRTVFENPYSNDPPPKKDLLTNTRYPYNAEGKLRELTNSWVTPISHHFVRNHGLVPDIDPKEYTLTITGIGVKETVFTLNQIKSFPRVDVTSIIQCNGNRREDYHFEKDGVPAFGPPHWVAGAIGCATWTGVRLRDLLASAGMDVDGISTRRILAPPNAQHIGLLAYDTDECGNQYCCSFPFEKAVDPFGDVIVAYQMNGQDIPRQHGYPVRCIVPGNAGARNCKFLERVTVTDSPCSGDTNWKQYAVHASDTPLQKLLDFNLHKEELVKDPPVQEMPVQSMVTIPSAGDVIAGKDKKTVYVKGLAWGGGGQGINRVDVSIDGGKNFTRAEMLEKGVKQPRRAEWGWVFFEKEVNLTEEMQAQLREGESVKLEVCSKACNTAWNSQPENPGANWNPHGCCVNHWYRVPIEVDPSATMDKRGPKGCFENKPSGGKFKTEFLNNKPCRDC
jgi:sulfite oxidase